MNEKLGKRTFPLLLREQRAAGSRVRVADGCIHGGNSAVNSEEQGKCDCLAYYPSNWIAKQNLLIISATRCTISFNLMEHSFCVALPGSGVTHENIKYVQTIRQFTLGGVYININIVRGHCYLSL
jgi:hypothetical protein